MSRWYRVFARGEQQPAPAVLLQHLRGLGVAGPVHFRGDEAGWTSVEISLAEGFSLLNVECFLASEPGIRAELNNWAAWLETCDYSPNHGPLMQQVIQTQQMIVIRKPLDAIDEVTLDRLLVATCRFLAARTDGVYQIDGQGWFSANGLLLLQEY